MFDIQIEVHSSYEYKILLIDGCTFWNKLCIIILMPSISEISTLIKYYQGIYHD